MREEIVSTWLKIVDLDVSIDTKKQKHPYCFPTSDLKQGIFSFNP